MKPVLGTGAVIDLKCDSISIPEFPDLLFGNALDDKGIYFDASVYLKKHPQLSVQDFFEKFSFQIEAIAKSYELTERELVLINTEGHQLMNGCLCYLFISYVDPQFCVFVFEVLDELFTNGFVISDTNLLSLVRKKLSPEMLKQILDSYVG